MDGLSTAAAPRLFGSLIGIDREPSVLLARAVFY